MPTTPPALTHLLRGLAVGRIALGGAALVAPGALARVLDIEATPELNYMSRIFAARAIALGTGYLRQRPFEWWTSDRRSTSRVRSTNPVTN